MLHIHRKCVEDGVELKIRSVSLKFAISSFKSPFFAVDIPSISFPKHEMLLVPVTFGLSFTRNQPYQ